MSKIPKTPQEVFPEIVEDLKGIYGAALQSVILYGSGARGEYVAGKSDINFLVVLADDVADDLEKVLSFVPKWKKRAVATPFFMTKALIGSSVDVYPVEFLNMKRHYQVVHGEDVLRDLVFEKRALRLQCERELKGKLMLLRTRFLETAGKAESLQRLMAASITAFLSVFNALLHLEGQRVSPRAAGDRGGRGRYVRDRRRALPALHRPAGGKEGPLARGIDGCLPVVHRRRFKS